VAEKTKPKIHEAGAIVLSHSHGQGGGLFQLQKDEV